MAEVSARPENLKKFVKAAAGIRDELANRISGLRASYDAYQLSGSPYIGNPDLLDQAIPTWLNKLNNDESFIQLVALAFEQADTGAGKVSMSEAAFTSAFNSVLAANGITPEMLNALDGAITVDDAIAAGIPRTSGFVLDPVCTATGHFLEAEDDFVWPARLEVLRWTRTYSSRFVAGGPLGRGWASWATTVCERQPDGTLAYHGPDGQMAIVPAAADADGGGDGGSDGWQRVNGLEAAFEPAPDGSIVLVWDAHSGRPGQRWTFAADGTITSVTGPLVGETTFEHEGGLLVGLVHDGGRRLDLEWDLARGRIVAVRSSCGRWAAYTYNEAGDLDATTRALGDRRYDVDDAGRIVAVFDADDVRLCHNTFDQEGRVVRQASPFGRETLFRYLPGRRTVVSDVTGGPVATYRHDASGRLVGLTNDLGQHLDRTFDGQGRCASARGFDGTMISQTFDPDGRVASLEGPGGYREDWEYDDAGRVVAHADAAGTRMTFDYAGDSQLPARVAGPDGWSIDLDITEGLVRTMTDADGVTVRMEYDGDGNVTAVANALGDTTRYAHHPSGEPASVEFADGSAFACDHDDAGRLLAMHAPTGDVWRVEYSSAGRRTALIEPNGATIRYEYGAHGGLERLVDAAGAAIEMRHDELEQLVGMTMADGAKWELSYGVLGQLSMVGDPTGASWLYDYDAEGRLTAATDPLGKRARQAFDAAGRLVSSIDRTGHVTRYTHDALGRTTAVEDPTGAATTVDRDAWGRPVAVTDPDGNTTRYTYTAAGRLREITSPDGRTMTYSYDGAGRLVEVTYGTGATTSYEWDACDRIVATRDAEGRERRASYDSMGRAIAVTVAGRTWTMGHDHTGRVTSVTDPTGGVVRYRFDARGKPVAATDALGNTVQWRYDARGNVIGVIDPLGGTVTTAFDAMRRPISTSDQAGRISRLERDAAGRITARVLPTGERREYALDARGLLWDVLVDGESVVVYERDAVGRPVLVHEPARNRTYSLSWSAAGVLERIDLDGADYLAWEYNADRLVTARTTGSRSRSTYRYDRAGRLIEKSGDRWGTVTLHRDRAGRLVALESAGVERRWDHDAAGFVIRYTDGGSVTDLVRDEAGRVVESRTGDQVVRYRYDRAGQLVSAVGPDGAWTWRYDAAGRMADEDGPAGRRTFLYDDVHQLVRIDGAGGPVVLTYDAAGRRIVESGAAGTTRYRWDGLGRLREIDRDGRSVSLDVDAFGDLVGVGETSLAWDSRGRGVPELLAIGDREVVEVAGRRFAMVDGAVEWLPADWRGTVGGIATDPWGASARDGVRLGFVGELQIDGLLWLHHRTYDPFTRQFLSCDPLPGVAGTPTAANAYHYGFNDPVGFVDPLGLQPLSIDQYNEIRAQETGPQWGTIAMIGLTAASFFIPGGPIVATLVGAGLGMAPGIINGVTTGNWDWGNIVKGGIVGGIAGRVGFGLGGGAGGLTSAMARGGAAGFAGGTGSEMYDLLPLPGSDGSFDPEHLLVDTAIGAATGGLGYRYRSRAPVHQTEVKAPTPVKPQDATSRWDNFLGDGPYTNTNPRTGQPDPDRLVSADGTHSIRYGSHEMNSKPTKHHYHEETWTYRPWSWSPHWDLGNTLVRVPLKP